MTRVQQGTDIDYGVLTQNLIRQFEMRGGELMLMHRATNIQKIQDPQELKKGYKWRITLMKNDMSKTGVTVQKTKFLFVGAGGYALPMLQKAGIPEVRGFAGFPISGQFLCCQNQEIVSKHRCKVYGKASVGAPPMSVPHLDQRIIDGKPFLLFGPYAGMASTAYLKHSGSCLDIAAYLRYHNIIPVVQ